MADAGEDDKYSDKNQKLGEIDVSDDDGEDEMLTSEDDSDDETLTSEDDSVDEDNAGEILTSEEDDDEEYYKEYYEGISEMEWDELKLHYCPEDSGEYDADQWSLYLRQISDDDYHFHVYHYNCRRPGEDDYNALEADKSLINYPIAATHFFNEAHEKDYKLEKILKINRELWGAGSDRHYITFQAKDSVTNSLDTFQAVVWEGITGEPIIVEFCRIHLPCPT